MNTNKLLQYIVYLYLLFIFSFLKFTIIYLFVYLIYHVNQVNLFLVPICLLPLGKHQN